MGVQCFRLLLLLLDSGNMFPNGIVRVVIVVGPVICVHRQPVVRRLD